MEKLRIVEKTIAIYRLKIIEKHRIRDKNQYYRAMIMKIPGIINIDKIIDRPRIIEQALQTSL